MVNEVYVFSEAELEVRREASEILNEDLRVAQARFDSLVAVYPDVDISALNEAHYSVLALEQSIKNDETVFACIPDKVCVRLTMAGSLGVEDVWRWVPVTVLKTRYTLFTE